MAHSEKVHIKQSYFRRLRNWFSRRAGRARRFLCGAYVEPEDRGDSDVSIVQDSEAAVGEAAEAAEVINKPKNHQSAIQTSFGITAEKHKLRGCTCGGFGEHPVTKTLSAHTALESDDVSPKASRSAPLLAGTSEVFSGLPDCRTSLLGTFHQANIPAMWNPEIPGFLREENLGYFHWVPSPVQRT